MAWGSLSGHGGTSNRSAATTLTHTIGGSGTIAAGRVATVRCASDNIATSSGTSNNHSSMADSQGNVWTKLYEYTRSSGAAADGVTGSVWISLLTNALTTGVDTITLTFSGSVTAKAMGVQSRTIGAGNTWQLDSNAGASGNGTTPSVTLNMTAGSIEYWLLGHNAVEGSGTETWTNDASYSSVFSVGTSSGSPADANITTNTGNRTFTGTSDTFDPTMGTAQDYVVTLTAIREVSASQNKNDSDTFTLTQEVGNPPGSSGTLQFYGSGIWGAGFQNCCGWNADGTRLLIGADDAGIHLSLDDGVTVTMENDGFGAIADRNISSIAWHPTNTMQVVISTNSGVFRSTDGGESWVLQSTAINYEGGDSTPGVSDGLPARHPRTTGNLLQWGTTVGGGNTNRWLYTASYDDGVYRSSDNGATWTRIWGAANNGIYLRSLAIVIQNGVDDLYVGAYADTGDHGGLYHIAAANGGTVANITTTKMSTPFNSVEEISTVVPGASTRRVYVAGGIITRDASGTITGEVGGIWKATNPGDSTSASWSRLGSSVLASSSEWAAIETLEGSGGADTIYIGCFGARKNGNGNSENSWRSTDGGTTWTCLTLNDAKIHDDQVGGPGGVQWWLGVSNPQSMVGTGGATVANIKIKPGDSSKVIFAGHAGAWKLQGAGTTDDWYPVVNGLQVTINWDVISDPTTPGRVYFANVDRGLISSTNRGTSVVGKDAVISGQTMFTASRAIALDTTVTPADVYLFGGNRDNNSQGNVIKATATQALTTNDDWTDLGLEAVAGGKRPLGGAVRKISGTVNVLAAVSASGIWRYRSGTWTLVKGAPPMTPALPNNKSARMSWIYDEVCYMVDPESGLWRGTNGSTLGGSTVMTKWTQLYAFNSQNNRTCYIVVDPVDREIVYVTNETGLYRVSNCYTATTAADVTVTSVSGISAPKALAIDANGWLYVTKEVSRTATQPKIYRTQQRSQNNPTWTAIDDTYYHEAGQWVVRLHLSDEGYAYLAMDGLGGMIGSNVAGAAQPISDSDSFTVTDADNPPATGVPVPITDPAGEAASLTAETESITVQVSDSDDADLFDIGPPPPESSGGAVTNVPPASPQLPNVTHLIISSEGVDSPSVKDWATDESGPGGYDTATGSIDANRVLGLPNVYQAGAKWQVWLEDGTLHWEGFMLQPALDDNGMANLSGRGWSHLGDREVDRLLFMSRDYSEWSTSDSDPYDYQQGDGSINADVKDGKLQFEVLKGEQANTGDHGSLVFWAEDNPLHSVAFTMHCNNGPQGPNVFKIKSAVGPGGQLSQEGNDYSITDNQQIDLLVNNTAQSDLVLLQLWRTGDPTDSITNGSRVWLKNVRVRGIATSDEMSTSAVVREVISRLHVEAGTIEPSGDNILPLDWQSNTMGALLDYCSLFADQTWRILSTGNGDPYCDFRDGDTWFTTRADGPTNLLPLSQYNRVVVKFPTNNGKHRQASANPADINIADPFEETGWVNAYKLTIDQPQADNDLPLQIARRLLRKLIVPRYGGDMQRQFLVDEAGHLQPAYRLHAGDYIRILDGTSSGAITVRVTHKRDDRTGSDFQLEDSDLAVESILARKFRSD